VEPKADRSLEKLRPWFRQRVEQLLATHPEVAVHEAWRSEERQAYLRKTGASKIERSKHQDGLAVDIHFKEAPHFPKSSDLRWDPVRRTAHHLGIDNGWDLWRWDGNHFQCAYNLKEWEYDFMDWAVENGITNGDDPKSPITLPRLMGLFKKFTNYIKNGKA